MDELLIQGGTPLRGQVPVSGAKNAALPIMAASLLAQRPVVLERIPRLTDVATMANLLRQLGMYVSWEKFPGQPDRLVLSTVDNRPQRADASFVQQMRASFCVLGPLLARRGRAEVPLPGGCQIGPRPIDLHLHGLVALGADLELQSNHVVLSAKTLKGAEIDLAGPHGSTVTGTANVMSAATLARGKTVIRHAAREPEIVDLGHFLNRLGAKITGLGTDTIEIEGVEALGEEVQYEVIPDRIEAATWLLAGAITGGEIEVQNVRPAHLRAAIEFLEAAGQQVEEKPDSVRVRGCPDIQPVSFTARPYPAMPTDIQAQAMAVLGLASGHSHVEDAVFPTRLAHVAQLRRLGAGIECHDGRVEISGVPGYYGAVLETTDLRASAALVLAGLAAAGETRLRNVHYLDRGYEDFLPKLRQLGANVRRVVSSDNVPLLAG